MWRISSDTGGTFTDCYATRPDGSEARCKVLSTGTLRARLERQVDETSWEVSGLPEVDDGFFIGFSAETLDGSRRSSKIIDWKQHSRLLIFDAPLPTAEAAGTLLEIGMGEEAPVLGARLLTNTRPAQPFPPIALRVATTRATNALLERKGSSIALFITKGFGDLLHIGDQRRSDLFALSHRARPVFVRETIEVEERVSSTGESIQSLDEASVEAEGQRLVESGIRRAAVALLHSTAAPDHELRIAALLREAGFEHVTLSSEVAPFAKILPRCQSAVANAYLTGPIESFVEGITTAMRDLSPPQIMTSSGGLEPCQTVLPKDLLLSGPAGGVVGAANAASAIQMTRVLTLDMGGTSTDVARIDGRPGVRFEQNVGGMKLLAPCVAIETVAAGGGSVCKLTPQGLSVGPDSAGSDPGPACYGKGGPLTLTDVNLLMGRFDPTRAPIPLDAEASRARLRELSREVRIKEREVSEQQLLQGFLDLACEIMADAIRRISVAEGYDPTDYTLLAFGGAGPQHACDVATRLGIQQVFAPHHAGILSAVGLHHSLRERFAGREVLRPFAEIAQDLPEMVSALVEEATRFLQADGVVPNEIAPPACLAEVRLQGQDAPVQVPFQTSGEILAGYGAAHERLFGYRPPKGRIPELVSLRISVRERADQRPTDAPKPESVERQAADQPQLLQDAFSTLVVPPEWKASRLKGIGYLVKHERNSNDSKTTVSPLLDRDLFRHRFHSVVDEMGALLCRTAISTNIRERLDFSCALLDANGHLISSAPHIPVHLGALGACVRHTLEVLDLKPGDTAITNHPAYGGSHLPDVTLITPVHLDDGTRLGFVASRAHHAEIGGKTPGSMPADATKLAEEGVVIAPRLLVERGVDRFAAIRELLEAGPWPSRNPADNIADLHAQLAANRLGADRLTKLAADDPSGLHGAMRDILSHSASVLRSHLDHLPQVCSARESLDDGHEIAVCVRRDADRLVIDFSGTSSTHPGNLNATPAIVRSAVLFFLRVLLREDLPLNEGLVESVDIVTPTGMLNPEFTGDPAEDPAVVGGNVEVSQRIVDTLFKAFELQAGSQGTMNNLLFGDASFGYYETIGGGAGAGPEQPGASGLHTHMTNTAITDPEILERRFPIRLRRFEVRRGSGGAGQLPGGDGLVREYEFLKPLTVSLLTQHRRAGPFGLHGGNPGSPGTQTIHRTDGSSVTLPSSATIEADIGDRLVMQTPGGGGWGVPD